MIARHFRKSDHARVESLVGKAAIDARGTHIELVEDGVAWALAVWYSPEDREHPAILGMVETIPPRQDMFYAAILAAAEAAIIAGHTQATFHILDYRIVSRIKRDFQEEPTPEGRNVKTGKPGHWELTVDLQSAVKKLRRFI